MRVTKLHCIFRQRLGFLAPLAEGRIALGAQIQQVSYPMRPLEFNVAVDKKSFQRLLDRLLRVEASVFRQRRVRTQRVWPRCEGRSSRRSIHCRTNSISGGIDQLSVTRYRAGQRMPHVTPLVHLPTMKDHDIDRHQKPPQRRIATRCQ